MPANNADEQRVEDRRAKAWDLRVMGKTYRQIGEALGVSHVTAWEDVKFVSERTRRDTDESVEHHRLVQLQRLDKAIAVLMPLIEAGSEDAISRALADGKDRKVVLAMSGSALEAMDRLDKLEKRRAALLGLDAATKQEISGPAGAPIEVNARGALIDKLAGLIVGEPAASPAGSDSREPDAG